MLRSIVDTAVASQTDMCLAGHCEQGELSEAIADSQADVLIVGEHSARPDAYLQRLLLRHPTLKIFVLTQDGRNASVLELRRGRLIDASPTSLIDAIRRMLRRDADEL
jgi:hypothetical protein